jgi:cystathionine gamma-lyase
MGALIFPAHHAVLTAHLRFLQNDIGAVPSAYDCWLAQHGVKTLHLHMQAHGKNALAVARILEQSWHVMEVVYPGLASPTALARSSLSPHARRFIATLPHDPDENDSFPYGGMISFRIRGGLTEAVRFLTSIRDCSH